MRKALVFIAAPAATLAGKVAAAFATSPNGDFATDKPDTTEPRARHLGELPAPSVRTGTLAHIETPNL
jgi:hypothetical protein